MAEKRAAIITGSAGGIGLGIAKCFIAAGHPVLMIDRNGELLEKEAELLRSDGANIVSSQVDVTNREEIEAAYAAARQKLGPLQIVVPNAGISNMIPFAAMTAAQWNETLTVNLTSMFHSIQAALPDMMEHQWGRIVTISSQAAQSGAPLQAHYSASKGGVIGLTKALARELAAHGITANTIPPSLVETPMLKTAVDAGLFPLEQVVGMIPISRAGQPEDIGHACVYLASEEASYVTGQVLGVNGGMYM